MLKRNPLFIHVSMQYIVESKHNIDMNNKTNQINYINKQTNKKTNAKMK